MNDTIGNPLSWTAKEVAAVGRQIGSFATHVGHDTGDLDAPRHPAHRRRAICARC